MLLQLEGLTMRFGGLTAVDGVSLAVEKGAIHGLIGPNGSGKTTIFNMVSGFYKPTSGHVVFEGRDVAGLAPHRITSLGIARTFQNLRLFRSMSVLQNVMVSMGHSGQTHLWQAFLSPAAMGAESRQFSAQAMKLLGLLQVSEYAAEPATSLPYGLQRRVEIARALAANPRLLLLDEPAAGLNDIEIDQLRDILLNIRASGITIFLVEHHMKLVMGVCDAVSVLDYGKKIAEGSCQEVSCNTAVIEAYLGKEEEL